MAQDVSLNKNQKSGHLGGPLDPVALAASNYTRLPYGANMTPKLPSKHEQLEPD